MLLDRRIDLGAIEGFRRSPDLVYEPFFRDELVLVTRTGNPLLPEGGKLRLKDLGSIPMISREPGSGTAEVVAHHLKQKGLDASALQVSLHLGATESIKRYVALSDTFAFLSRSSLSQELDARRLTMVPVAGLQIVRELCFALRLGEPLPLSTLLMKSVRQHHARTKKGGPAQAGPP